MPGVFQVADLVDIAAARAPRPLLLEAMVDGRNTRLSAREVTGSFRPLALAYEKRLVTGNLLLRAESGSVAAWLAGQLQ